MIAFIVGLLFGGLSGGITHALTGDSRLAVIVGLIAAVLTWLGGATLIVLDD
ncbi:hypothetical protein [Streptomyces sp. NPDC047097]|uniref:hypothetical protein n=1 Tax=Streptomyces sp. NPDC047097 TaxID=3155260 RepID=UPI0033FFC9D0